MSHDELKKLLSDFKSGVVTEEKIFNYLKRYSIEELDFANLDHARAIRIGYPEVIYSEGKTHEQVCAILKALLKKNNKVLATRASKECYEYSKKEIPELVYHPEARIITTEETLADGKNEELKIGVLCAGTSDIPVAEEAAVTALAMGCGIQKIFDVGIAGIHRLLSKIENLQECSVIIVVAGMEGALASAVGGLVDTPVIAVPTSIGYGASFGGVAALLAMLNSCAPGVTVVNIDNGFGAAYAAAQIIMSLKRQKNK